MLSFDVFDEKYSRAKLFSVDQGKPELSGKSKLKIRAKNLKI